MTHFSDCVVLSYRPERDAAARALWGVHWRGFVSYCRALCFDQISNGWDMPQRSGWTISSKQIALEMKVNFDYQIDGKTRLPRPEVSFPVEELVEYRTAGVDFAIVRLGKNGRGEFPGTRYPILQLATTRPTPLMTLCVIQHPDGRPKRVEAGPLKAFDDQYLDYDDIDTLNASSGVTALSPDGLISGIHVLGGCDDPTFGRVKSAITATRIRQVSITL